MLKQSDKMKFTPSVDTIILGIQEKKGKQISIMDLSGIENCMSKYFVICHGTSKPHVEAISESVDEFMRQVGEKPINKEGHTNAEWILMDYFDIVVHIFQEPVRQFYKLEELWADADIHHIKDID